ILALALSPLFIACNQGIKDENASLKLNNEELLLENQQKDSLINDFISSFASIQENLASIREREEAIQNAQEQGLENAPNLREEVLRDVEAINELLSENKQTITDLNDKV